MEWRRHPVLSHYEVSECGDLRGRGNRRHRGFIDQDGYLKYVVTDDNGVKSPICAHRLVAETYLGPAPSPAYEVAHNNGSRVANHYTNLRWATRSENDSDRVVHGTAPVGFKNGNAKLSEQDVIDIRRKYRAIKDRLVDGKISDLARSYNLHHASLISVATGKSWQHIPMDREDA